MKLLIFSVFFLTACFSQDPSNPSPSPNNRKGDTGIQTPPSENESSWSEGDYYMYVNTLDVTVDVKYLDYTPADGFDSGRVVGSLESGECLLFDRDVANLISFITVEKNGLCRSDCGGLFGCKFCPTIPGHYNIIERSQPWESHFESRKESIPSHSECKSLRTMLQ